MVTSNILFLGQLNVWLIFNILFKEIKYMVLKIENLIIIVYYNTYYTVLLENVIFRYVYM